MQEEGEKYDISSKYHYLTENALLEESPKAVRYPQVPGKHSHAGHQQGPERHPQLGLPQHPRRLPAPNMMKLSLGSTGKVHPEAHVWQ